MSTRRAHHAMVTGDNPAILPRRAQLDSLCAELQASVGDGPSRRSCLQHHLDDPHRRLPAIDDQHNGVTELTRLASSGRTVGDFSSASVAQSGATPPGFTPSRRRFSRRPRLPPSGFSGLDLRVGHKSVSSRSSEGSAGFIPSLTYEGSWSRLPLHDEIAATPAGPGDPLPSNGDQPEGTDQPSAGSETKLGDCEAQGDRGARAALWNRGGTGSGVPRRVPADGYRPALARLPGPGG